MTGRIDPNTIYSADDLSTLLKGHLSLEELRRFGRLGFPGGGYWGQAVIDAIDSWFREQTRQGGMAHGKDWNHATKQRNDSSPNNREMERRSAKRKAQSETHGNIAGLYPSTTESDNVESLGREFDRLVTAADQESICSKGSGGSSRSRGAAGSRASARIKK